MVLTECIALPQASATDGVWTGNVYNASWSTPGNWTNGAVASGSGATATFVNSSNLSQANQDIEGLTLGSIRLHGTAVTLLNKSITFDNGSVSPELYTGSDLFLRFSIAGSGALPMLKTGASTLTFSPDNGTNTFSCGFSLNQGSAIVATTRDGLPLGTGNLFLNGISSLRFNNGGYAYTAITNRDAVLGFSDAASIFMKTGMTTATSITLGNPGASANSVLRRDNHGILLLDSSTHAFGGGAKILVNGGVAVSDGVTCLPMVITAGGGDNDGSFVNYIEGIGLTNANQLLNGVTNGATTIGSVTNNTTLSTNATVRALRIVVSGPCRDVLLTVANGSTLNVGDGTNPAMVLLGYDYNFHHGSILGGTLNFGTSEGIISFGGTCNVNTAWPSIISTIDGSGGVTFAGRGTGWLCFYRNNTYTGPTHLLMGSVVPNGTLTRPFSGDDLYIHGSSTSGGQLQFGQLIGAITNRLHVSGVGVAMNWRGTYRQPTGSIIFVGTSGTNSGPVELTGDTRFSAPGSTNNYGLISGPISGNYGIEIGYTNIYANEQFGTVRFSGTNTYTGLTKISGGTLELRSPASISQGPYLVSTNLVFNFAGNATFTNVITGSGRIIQNGGGLVRLTKASSFTGTFIANSGEILLGDASATIIVIR